MEVKRIKHPKSAIPQGCCFAIRLSLLFLTFAHEATSRHLIKGDETLDHQNPAPLLKV